MYYCNRCKRFVNISRWEDGKKRCEVCGNPDLSKAKKCNICGDPTLDSLCDWCEDEQLKERKHYGI